MGTKWEDLFAALAAPLPEEAVKAKVGKGNKVQRYTTARAVMNRFDDVLGPENWRDSYDAGPDGALFCRITIVLPDGTEVTKGDVGAAQGSDDGMRRKALYSDALKRAAIKFGVGRHLYNDGMPEFVRRKLGFEGGKARRAKAGTPGGGPTPPDRAAINGAFAPASRPAPDLASRERVKLPGDRIGAHGTDVRRWLQVVEAATAWAVKAAADRTADLGMEPQPPLTNVHAVTNHLVTAAVDAAVMEAPLEIGKDGRSVRASSGKLTRALSELYGASPELRDWMRRELKRYLRAEVEAAVADARAERERVEEVLDRQAERERVDREPPAADDDLDADGVPAGAGDAYEPSEEGR